MLPTNIKEIIFFLYCGRMELRILSFCIVLENVQIYINKHRKLGMSRLSTFITLIFHVKKRVSFGADTWNTCLALAFITEDLYPYPSYTTRGW